MTIERGIPNSKDIQSRGTLYQQVMELTDLILEGYVTQLESIRLSAGEDNSQYEELEQRYHQERFSLIKPLSKDDVSIWRWITDVSPVFNSIQVTFILINSHKYRPSFGLFQKEKNLSENLYLYLR